MSMVLSAELIALHAHRGERWSGEDTPAVIEAHQGRGAVGHLVAE